VYVRVPNTVANVQKRVGASDFSGTVASYASNNGCSGQPSASETFNPSSNPLGCLSLASGDPIQSVNVNSDDTSDPTYTIYFYTDTACTNQVTDFDVDDGVQCNDPSVSVPVMSVYVIRGTYDA
jgi:hypothetical protein